jgi:hypothetical protein
MPSDPDTQTFLREGEELRRLLEGDAWGIAVRKLEEELALLRDVTNIPDDLDIQEYGIEAYSRKQAISLYEGWLNSLRTHITNYEAYIAQQRAQQEDEPIVREH